MQNIVLYTVNQRENLITCKGYFITAAQDTIRVFPLLDNSFRSFLKHANGKEKSYKNENVIIIVPFRYSLISKCTS